MDDLEKVIRFAFKDVGIKDSIHDAAVIAQVVREWMEKEEEKKNYIRLVCGCLKEVEPDE